MNGLVVPQYTPPGVKEFGEIERIENHSQIAQLQALICQTDDTPWPVESHHDLDVREERLILRHPPKACSGTFRVPDAILLAIGGNDVGFAGVIMDRLLPEARAGVFGSMMLDAARSRVNAVPPEEAARRIEQVLPARLDLAAEAIRFALPRADDLLIIQSGYPDPLTDENGAFCRGFSDNLLLTAARGALPDRITPGERRWHFEISDAESLTAREALIAPLNQLLVDRAERQSRNYGFRWRIANQRMLGEDSLFRRRGWCAAANDAEHRQFHLPYWDEFRDPDPGWTPFSPAGFKAYPETPTQRWFRAPNDAALTSVSSDRRIGLGAVNIATGPQGALDGSFHPNLAGHVAMALDTFDILVEHLGSGGN